MTAENTTRSGYDAARATAVWFDRGGEGLLEVRGADRVSWLQGLLSNDVAALGPGQGCYAAYLTPQGRMIADVRVLVREEACWLDVPGAETSAVLSRLDMFVISEDVTLRDLTAETARIAVHGPMAAEAIARAFVRGADRRDACARALAALNEHDHAAHDWHGADVLVASTADLGPPGFDVYVAAARRDEVIAALEQEGVVPGQEHEREVLRIEAGRPRFGADLDAQTIPLEAGLEDRAISFTKGCYVGQEVIVRVRDRGQGRVARRLMRLAEAAGASPDDPALPAARFAAGDAIVIGTDRVGVVTSAAWSPRDGRTIGLGYVQRAHATPETLASVEHGLTLVAVVLT